MDGVGKRKVLGRGLGALIPGAPAAEPPRVAKNTAPLTSIRPNPLQPRQSFSEDSIAELADSIQQQGVLQPLLVRPVPGGYELIAGERRWRAAQRAGLDEIPIAIHDVGDSDALQIALIENIQRENLNPIEEARAYQRLVDEFELSHEDVAHKVSKDRSTVANTLRLLQLPESVRNDIERGVISAGHARALLAVPSDGDRVALARKIATERLTVREAEAIAKRVRLPVVDADQRAAEQRLTEGLGTRVRLHPRRNGGGKIEIEYYSLDALNALVDRLLAS